MIILDTNALIWWSTAPEKLSKKARKTIDESIKKEYIFISSISIWEVYLLVKKDKVELLLDIDSWLEKLEYLPFVKFIPVDNRIATHSVNLPDFEYKDPADRIIIATALNLGAKLVTSDKRILNYPHLQSIW